MSLSYIVKSTPLQKLRNFIQRYPILTVALYIAAVGNTALWTEFMRIESGVSIKSLLFASAFYLLIVLLTSLLLTLFRFRYLLKPLLMLVLICSSLAAYYMAQYGVVLDVSMMYNIAETDSREVYDLISLGSAVYVLLLGVVPALFVARLDIAFGSFPRQLVRNVAIIALCILGIVVNAVLFYGDYASLFRNHHHVRYLVNPINYVYSLGAFAGQKWRSHDNSIIPVGLDARQIKQTQSTGKHSVIVLVVGETARAKNFSLNGYVKNTNPLLSRHDIINYPDVHSCGTSTHTSLPCMFSHLARNDFDESQAVRYEKLPDVLKRAGLDVVWRDNNSGCKGVCRNVETENMYNMKLADVCNDYECYDEVLLDHLQDRIESGDRDMLIILHQKGSHGPAYYLRHPPAFSFFTPECHSSDLSSCTSEEVMNAYDNTIAYTDYFLTKVIELLEQESEKYDTAMLYISDHGESLGEHHLYLHSLPYLIAPEEQKRVPFIAWYSDDFLIDHQLDKACLRKRAAEQPVSHDYLFHSLLGLNDISTSVYNPELDLYRPCRISRPLVIGQDLRNDSHAL